MSSKRRPQRPRHWARPVIAPDSIKEYLARPLDDWRWIKDVPREALQECVPRGFKFLTDPRLHQLAAFVLGTQLERFLYFLGMGSGKTKLLLDLIRYRKHTGELKGALIGVPNVINLASWEAQLVQHAPDLSYRVLHGSRTKRYAMLDEEPADIYLINYAGLSTYMASENRRTKSGKSRRVMVAEDANDFASLFNFVGLDESHLAVGHVGSLQYQLLKHLSWRADFCYGATGMAHGKDPEMLWPQFYVVDQGETFGASLGIFHEAFYTTKENRFKRSGLDYVYKPANDAKVHRMLQHRSLRYSDDEFTDLPALVTPYAIPVTLTRAQVQRYEELVEMARAAEVAGEPPTPVWIRQRQTVAGFIAIRGEDVDELDVEFVPNPKAEALEEFLREFPDDEKLVIFHHYIYTGVIISRVLKKLGIEHAGVGGLWKDPKAQLRRFLTSPSCRVWVANCKAGGTGTDGLQHVCRWGMFYESPSDPITRQQAIKRLHRDGQQKRVYFADLVAENVSIDKRTLRNVRKGIDSFKAVMEGKERVE